jgi:hypothetical protein
MSIPELISVHYSFVRSAEIDFKEMRPPGRIADEIVAATPDLVGLRKIAKRSAGTPCAVLPGSDFLLPILAALRNQGAFYLCIAINKDLDPRGH